MKRKAPDGTSTTDLILSGSVGKNEDLFPQILNLHVPQGAVIADVTYGKGAFWKNVDTRRYQTLFSDIYDGVDLRALPYEDNSIDCVVLDPPYMEGFFRREGTEAAGGGTHASFRNHYSNGSQISEETTAKWHEAVISLYEEGIKEAHRVLVNGGTLLVKCQDEVSANLQRLTHVEIINFGALLGFYTKDIFVLMRENKPGVSRIIKQVHARKNHSYFLVLTKEKRKSAKQNALRLSHGVEPISR